MAEMESKWMDLEEEEREDSKERKQWKKRKPVTEHGEPDKAKKQKQSIVTLKLTTPTKDDESRPKSDLGEGTSGSRGDMREAAIVAVPLQKPAASPNVKPALEAKTAVKRKIAGKNSETVGRVDGVGKAIEVSNPVDESKKHSV